MEKGNVLVIGNSGVGKSTLINGVLGNDYAKTGFGSTGVTDRLEIYESHSISFRIIDTIGFEPSVFKEWKTINAVKSWSKQSIKEGRGDTKINVIWFCVEGTSRKFFLKAIKDVLKATKMWSSVPVIVVITKSYSVLEREENIQMVYDAIAAYKQYPINLKRVIPVVAQTYFINESTFVLPEGISELIAVTNELLPEGIQASEGDISTFQLKRKRTLSHGIVGVATTSAVVIGAVPIPFSDAAILGPIEVAEINAIVRIYGIPQDENAKQFISSIIEVGTVGVVAKTAISALKAIPGVNVGVSVLNAMIAGSLVAAIGEGAIYAVEQVYTGKKDTNDLDWVKKVIESKLTSQFVEKFNDILRTSSEEGDLKSVAKNIIDLFLSEDK